MLYWQYLLLNCGGMQMACWYGLFQDDFGNLIECIKPPSPEWTELDLENDYESLH